MKVRTIQHTSGVVNQINVKLTKRDLVKVFVLMSAVSAVASLPVGYVRRNLVDEAVRRIENAASKNYRGEDA